MSLEETQADLEAAVQAHIAEQHGDYHVTDFTVIAAACRIEDIGSGDTRYYVSGNTGQPVHVTLGLVAYVAAHGPYQDADDDDEDDD